MANPALENQVLLNRMFADTMDPFNRYFAQQLNLAAGDLQRRRLMEDEARQILTASKVRTDEHKFQMDREESVMKRYIAVEDARRKTAESVEDARTKRYEAMVKARESVLDDRENAKQTKFDMDTEGWNESFRQRSKERADLVTKRTQLESISPEEHNKAVRRIARKYVKNDNVLNKFFPANYKGDLEPLLSQYITDDKDKLNAEEDLAKEVMMIRAMRQPQIDALNRELSDIDMRLRGLDTKVSPAAHFPKPSPPLPPGFPGTPGAPGGSSVFGPTAGMTDEQKWAAYNNEIAKVTGGGPGTVAPSAPPAALAPYSPPMTGLFPRAARAVAGAVPGAWDVTKQIGGEVAAPAFAAAGGAYDVLMSGSPPMSVQAYGGSMPQPYRPTSKGMPPVPLSLRSNPNMAGLAGMSGAQGPDLGALGLTKPDLMGMRDLYLRDRQSAGISQQQADSELNSIVAKLDTGDGEARKIFQEYHKRWLQKKAMRGVVPQAIPNTMTNAMPLPAWGTTSAPEAPPGVIPRTTMNATDLYRMRRGLPGVSTNVMPLPQWGTGWQ